MYWISNETTLKLREIVQSKEESKILPDATHSLVKLSDGLINFNFNFLKYEKDLIRNRIVVSDYFRIA